MQFNTIHYHYYSLYVHFLHRFGLLEGFHAGWVLCFEIPLSLVSSFNFQHFFPDTTPFPSVSLVSVISLIGPSFFFGAEYYLETSLSGQQFLQCSLSLMYVRIQEGGGKQRKVWKANQHGRSIWTISAVTVPNPCSYFCPWESVDSGLRASEGFYWLFN